MTRQKFCATCKELRLQEPTTSINEVWRRTDFQPTQIKRMENGSNNFNMLNGFKYLSAIAVKLIVKKPTSTPPPRILKNYPQFVEWVKKNREINGITQAQLALAAGCKKLTVTNIETQKSIATIDTFLKVIEAFGFEVELVAKK